LVKDKYSGKREGSLPLKNRLLALLLLALIGFSGFHFMKTKYKQNKISEEVEELQKQIADFEKKNKNLEQLAGYLQTDEFKTREAKEKLNLVKEGEKVIIAKKQEVEEAIEAIDIQKPEVKIDRPNYYYWWHYFFGIKPETTSTNSYE